jgi:signal transduction histidine kinase
VIERSPHPDSTSPTDAAPAPLHAALQALPDPVVLLDGAGRIVAVNPAMTRFLATCGTDPRTHAPGADYVRGFRAMLGETSVAGHACAQSLRDRLDGRAGSPEMEYPCHRRGDRRWLAMTVTPFSHSGRGFFIATHRDVSSMRKALIERAHSEHQLRAALDGAGVSVWELDPRRDHATLGRSDRLLDFGPGSFPGTYRALLRSLHAEDRAAFDRVVRSAITGGAAPSLQFRTLRPGGEVRHILARGRVIRNADSRPRHMSLVCTDITERVERATIEGELESMRRAAKAMNRVLGVVAHELRTPLAGIRAGAECLLLDESVDPVAWRVGLKSIAENAAGMAQTIDTLLDAGRLTGSSPATPWEQVDPAELCAQAVDTVEALAVGGPSGTGRVRLETAVLPGCGRIAGDADGLRRMLVNLLGNAVRATRGGTVRLSAARADVPGPERWIDLSVADSGMGMTPAALAKLGEPFALSSTKAGDQGAHGSGLGLWICRIVAASHGGWLTVSSAPGRGTTMTARIRADLEAAVSGGVAPPPIRVAGDQLWEAAA